MNLMKCAPCRHIESMKCVIVAPSQFVIHVQMYVYISLMTNECLPLSPPTLLSCPPARYVVANKTCCLCCFYCSGRVGSGITKHLNVMSCKLPCPGPFYAFLQALLLLLLQKMEKTAFKSQEAKAKATLESKQTM